MIQSTTALKRKIKSVTSTRKISNAMALVATSKLQKQRKFMVNNNTFADTYSRLLDIVLSCKKEGEETNPFLTKKDINNPLHIVLTSNSGLCGSYNIEIVKYVKKNFKKEDAIFAIGTYGAKALMEEDYCVVKQFHDMNDFVPSKVSELVSDVLLLYTRNEISSLDITFTKYSNTLNYIPSTISLLPIENPHINVNKEMLLEPGREELLNQLVPQYINSQIYACFLQAKTSEQVARISSMEAAKNNADGLLDELSLQYNQARQASITQEMNEISGAANYGG